MAVERRQGMCRALAHHLEALHLSDSEAERRDALQGLMQVASGLYNPYAGQAMTPDSRAAPRIWTDDGKRFRQLRGDLVGQARAAYRDKNPLVPHQIEMTCAACHLEMATDLPEWGQLQQPERRLGYASEAWAQRVVYREPDADLAQGLALGLQPVARATNTTE